MVLSQRRGPKCVVLTFLGPTRRHVSGPNLGPLASGPNVVLSPRDRKTKMAAVLNSVDWGQENDEPAINKAI